MKQGGRPRREDEQPDSPFGEALKEHLQRVKNFTQADLAKESIISEKTISNMVKGKRSTSGTTLRRDLRAIIKALYRKEVLRSLEEANLLITKIPTVKELDERDPEDRRIIELFSTSPSTTQPPVHQQDDKVAASLPDDTSESEESVSLANPVQEEQASPPPQTEAPSASGTPLNTERETRQHRRRRVGYLLAALLIIFGIVFGLAWSIFWRQTDACAGKTNGVILYTDPDFQGHCHVFPPGDYDLAQFGLDQNVSSIKDPGAGYYVRLIDRTNRPGSFDKDVPQLPADWNDQAHSLHVEKHRPTACHPGTNGIIAFIDTDYSGGCLFITENIPDLTPLDFDQIIVSIQFVGSYQNTRQLVIYRQPDYKDECGAYWQNQSDLLQCARLALSVRVLPFTSPTPIPTIPGTRAAGNVASQAMLSPGGTRAVVDGSLQTEWVGGHMVELDLRWAFPITIHRVVVWDRKQSVSDNNQINKLKLSSSDGTSTGSIDMISQGPRCADVTFPAKTITWLHIIPVDASGNNGLREVEVWATSGPQYSNNT
jgi:transcriptional regulator with XRE-family HTH domain